MVQVRRSIEQLDVGEGNREHDHAHAIERAGGDPERRHADDPVDDVHPRGGHRSDPLQPRIGEVDRGRDVEIVDPALELVARDVDRHHHPEEDPKGDERRRIDVLSEPRPQFRTTQSPSVGLNVTVMFNAAAISTASTNWSSLTAW